MVPNVVVIMADQMKATASHLYGSTFCETPSLARLAARGVLYEHAFTPHPLCVPARTSLWSGRYPHGHGSRRNETLIRPEVDNAFAIWREAGMATALIGKNHCFDDEQSAVLFDVRCELGHLGRFRCPDPVGMEWLHPVADIDAASAVRRDMPPVSTRFSWAVTDTPEQDHPTGILTDQAVRYIEENADKPFALWVSYPDPHEPYVAPRRYAEMVPPECVALPPSREGEFDDAPPVNRTLHDMLGTEEDNEADVRAAIAVYHAQVKFVDDGVGAILDALEAQGLTESTIVVFCADHGDFAGEHGMFSKGGVFYDCLVRIPLIISYPGHAPAGVREPSMANLVDVMPTVLKMQGVRPLALAHGQPLPALVAEAEPRSLAFSEYGAGGPAVTAEDIAALAPATGYTALLASLWPREADNRRKMVRSADWKYVYDPRGDGDELYDLVDDPAELVNVATLPGNAGVISELQLALLNWSIATEDGHPVPLP